MSKRVYKKIDENSIEITSEVTAVVTVKETLVRMNNTIQAIVDAQAKIKEAQEFIEQQKKLFNEWVDMFEQAKKDTWIEIDVPKKIIDVNNLPKVNVMKD